MVDILFGDVVPSGKLPHTMPNKWNEVGMTLAQYPGIPPTNASGNACADRPAIWLARGDIVILHWHWRPLTVIP